MTTQPVDYQSSAFSPKKPLRHQWIGILMLFAQFPWVFVAGAICWSFISGDQDPSNLPWSTWLLEFVLAVAPSLIAAVTGVSGLVRGTTGKARLLSLISLTCGSLVCSVFFLLMLFNSLKGH